MTDIQFIDIWQTSNNIKEVETKTGMNRKAIYARVSRYRKREIPMKRFRHATALLIRRAEQLAPNYQLQEN